MSAIDREARATSLLDNFMSRASSSGIRHADHQRKIMYGVAWAGVALTVLAISAVVFAVFFPPAGIFLGILGMISVKVVVSTLVVITGVTTCACFLRAKAIDKLFKSCQTKVLLHPIWLVMLPRSAASVNRKIIEQ
jgi:hypothetical protein